MANGERKQSQNWNRSLDWKQGIAQATFSSDSGFKRLGFIQLEQDYHFVTSLSYLEGGYIRQEDEGTWKRYIDNLKYCCITPMDEEDWILWSLNPIREYVPIIGYKALLQRAEMIYNFGGGNWLGN